MTTAAISTAPTTGAFRSTPVLLLLFAGSGCAALVYEVVWFHLLRLVVGSTAISLGFLLGSFMGGMCLGSLLLPRLLARRHHPLRVYAALEIGIGAIGLLLPTLLPVLGDLYTESFGGGPTGLVLRGAVCAGALILPTMLMGATLPAIARWMDTTRTGIASMGLFYGANIGGAVLGTLLAGFWLLRVHDTVVATWFAASVNGIVAVVALVLAGRSGPGSAPAEPSPVADSGPAPRANRLIHVAIAVSGFTALGAEVLWTRLLSLLFGASVYTFALILAVFLVGLGIGSGIGSRLAARSERPRLWFGACQLLLVPTVLYSAFVITAVIPYGEPTFVFQKVVYQNMWLRYPWDFLRCALAILPGPILWGASFPLALAASGVGARDPGRLVGGVYAANTVGAIGGALTVSLLFLGEQGTRVTQQILAGMALVTGLVLVVPVLAAASSGGMRRLRVFWKCTVAVAIGCGLLFLIPGAPRGLIAFGRNIDDWDAPDSYLYVAEGINASVAVTDVDGFLNFHVSGKVVASTERLDMRLQRMLGHLPTLAHPDPRSVLIVGCGAGVTAGCFTEYPGIERIVICEIEPRVIEAARRYFGESNRGVLDDPRTEIVVDDARHFLATTEEKFDIVTSDPIHPWVRGAAALYSVEYYDLVKRRLHQGALVTQWVPLYQTDEESVKSQVGTFFKAFPQGTVWNSDVEEYGYDLVMMARVGTMTIDVDAIAQRLARLPTVRQALDEVDLGTAILLMKTYAGRAPDLVPWLRSAQINDDVGLRLQYLAGLSLDVYRDEEIYGVIKSHFRYPEGLFLASSLVETDLRQALAR